MYDIFIKPHTHSGNLFLPVNLVRSKPWGLFFFVMTREHNGKSVSFHLNIPGNKSASATSSFDHLTSTKAPI